MSKPAYVPPKVWRNDAASGGQFASINRPVAGPTTTRTCRWATPAAAVFLATPNGVKVTIALEELLAWATPAPNTMPG
jgi:GST-like protein